MILTLLSKLERSECGSRELDAEIWLATTEGATRRTTTIKSATNLWAPYDIDETRDATGRLIIVPSYTESLNAAVALVNRLLPGAEYEITTLYGVADVTLPMNFTDIDQQVGRREDGNVPLAIVIAALRALSKDTDHEKH